MARTCSLCRQRLPDEEFGASGDAVHICNDCRQSTSKEDRRKLLLKKEVLDFFKQRSISPKNCRRLSEIILDTDGEIKQLAEVMLRVGEAFPEAKRRRGFLFENNRPLFDELVALSLVAAWEDRSSKKAASEKLNSGKNDKSDAPKAES